MTVPIPALDAARYAYFGHRFEPSKIGFFPEVHIYDLVGAYAWAVQQVPCLAHGEWVDHYPPGTSTDDLEGIPGVVTMRLVEWNTPLSRIRPWGA